MRQVNRDELLWNVQLGMRFARESLFEEAVCGDRTREDRAKAWIAEAVVRQLDRYEVLSDTEVTHPSGDSLFTAAANRAHGGDIGSGVPSV
jgi:hypothetical protein